MTDTLRTTAPARSFAPTGTLRASINLGNPNLAKRDPATGEPFGVSIDLARRLAERLALPLELVVFETARDSVEAVAAERADFGFFAIDPLRGEKIAFTAPYVLIEGVYLVREHSPIQSAHEVDTTGHRVVVGKGTAYDLFLTREIKSASIVHTPTSADVIGAFLEHGFEVAAGVRQQIEAEAKKTAGLRILEPAFMTIPQAMGIPKSRGEETAAELHAFVEEMKSSGFVAAALARHGIAGATVAPPALP